MPPQKPLIVDDRGRTVEGEVGIGPFREGESLSLECNVPGGKRNDYLGKYYYRSSMSSWCHTQAGGQGGRAEQGRQF